MSLVSVCRRLSRFRLLLAVALVAGLLFPMGCGPKQPPAGGGAGGGGTTPADPLAKLVLTTTKVTDLGKAEIKDPAPESLLDLAGWGKAPPNQVWVMLKDGQGSADANTVASALGGTIVGEVAFLGAYQIQTKDSTADALLATLAKAGGLEQVELALPNAQVAFKLGATTAEIVDPTQNANYKDGNGRAHQMVGLRDAWAMVAGSGLPLAGVHVGVTDSTVWATSGEYNNPGGTQVFALSREDLDAEPLTADRSALTHGTNVTNILAADHRVGGAIGVASVLGGKLKVSVRNFFDGRPENVELTGSAGGPAEGTWNGTTYLIKGMVYLMKQVEAGASILNCSFGITAPKPANPDPIGTMDRNRDVNAAYRRFLDRLSVAQPQVLVVAAAGNDDTNISPEVSQWGQPVGNLITVAALDPDGSRRSSSNYEEGSECEISIAAPGGRVVTGIDGAGRTVTGSGTSYATPMVTGAAAILRSIKPDLTAAQLKTIVIETASRTVKSEDGRTNVTIPAEVGGRILRVDNAVLRVVNMVRSSRGLSQYTREDLLGLYDISASVSGGPGEYIVKASVAKAAEGRDDLTLKVAAGQATVSGNATISVVGSRQASWTVKRGANSEGQIELEITRAPAGSAAKIIIPASGGISKLSGTKAITLDASTDSATAGYAGFTFRVDSDRKEGLMTVTAFDSALIWDGAAFSGYRYVEAKGVLPKRTSVKGQLAADGTGIEWIEFKWEEGLADQGTLYTVVEMRFEGLPLVEEKGRYAARSSSAATAQASLKSYMTRTYQGQPGSRKVVREFTAAVFTGVTILFKL